MTSGAELTWQATVAANLLKARKKNGRIGSRKSRAGCLTCKIRRVKCDERKPECERCMVAGRKCDGYVPMVPRKTSNSLIGGQLSQALGLRDGERRTFDYFLSWTAPRLAGPMDKFFWCGQVLQLAQSEPVVVNSLLAISTLYEHPQFLKSFYSDPERASTLLKVTVPPANRGWNVSKPDSPLANSKHGREIQASAALEAPPHPSIARPPIDQHHMIALRHYNRAIQAFKTHMETGRATPGLALLSCVLFICIELLRDHVFQALNLFAKGLTLLKQISTNPKSIEDPLLRTLKLIFGRLGLMAAVFGYPLDVPQEYVDMDTIEPFTNVEDARTALWALMFESHAFIRDAAAHKANIGYEEPQDPMSFNADPVPPDSATETGRAKFPSSLGVPPEEPVTRLYVGCLPQGDMEPAHSGLDSGSLFSDERPLSSSPSIDSAQSGVHLQGEGNAPTRPESQDKSSYSAASSQSLSHTLGSSTTDSLPLHLSEESASSATEQLRRHRDAGSDIAKTASWWVPPELLERQMMLERRLGQWYEAFDWVRGTDEEASSSLLMQYHVTFIWQKTRLSPHQTVFDQFTSHFEEILRLALIFIDSTPTERPTFTFEIGVVPQLYFLVTKCRVPSVRRKGLELMTKAPRKECMFGSKSCAELAARLVAIEEEGLDLASVEVEDSVLPPEENRVQTYEIVQDNVAAQYYVRVTRYRIDEYGRRGRLITDFPM